MTQTTESFPDDQSIENLPQETQDEIRSQWLNRILRENPHILALRERLLPKTGGLSFANVVHTEDVGSMAALDRHSLLELIYQHLQAIGFYQTAELIAQETSHSFQTKEQPWERTDLHLIASMAVGHLDDVWALSPEPGFEPILEYLDEDFFSSPYTEDPSIIWDEVNSKSLQIHYKVPSGPRTLDNIQSASLRALTYSLITTPPSSNDNFKNDLMKHCFFLTLHSITSSLHFLQHLNTLYEGKTSNGTSVDPEKLALIQKNIISFLRSWILFQGRFIGNRTLKAISQFLTRVTQDPKTEKTVNQNALQLLKLVPKVSFGQAVLIDSSKLDEPNIPNPNVIFNPNLKLFDPEAIEVARQITLIAHEVFSEIPPLEFFTLLSEGKASIHTPTVQEFLDFSGRMGLLMAETIVTSRNPKEAYRKALVISKHLLDMGNYDTVGSIMVMLKRQEFISIAGLTPTEFEELNRILRASGEDDKNAVTRPTTYQVDINKRSGKDPTVPNVRAALINLDKAITMQADFVHGLVNWNKRREMGSWQNIMYGFQSLPYHFCPIPQIQRLLKKGPTMEQSRVDALLLHIKGK